MRFSKKWVVLAFCLHMVIPYSAWAQQPAPAGGSAEPMMDPNGVPPMRNVFYNVLWGAVAGGVVYEAKNILDDTRTKAERYSFSRMTDQFFFGATMGGLIGLGAGVYFSMSDIRFDAGRSRIAQRPLLARPLYGDEILLANYQFRF